MHHCHLTIPKYIEFSPPVLPLFFQPVGRRRCSQLGAVRPQGARAPRQHLRERGRQHAGLPELPGLVPPPADQHGGHHVARRMVRQVGAVRAGDSGMAAEGQMDASIIATHLQAKPDSGRGYCRLFVFFYFFKRNVENSALSLFLFSP